MERKDWDTGLIYWNDNVYIIKHQTFKDYYDVMAGIPNEKGDFEINKIYQSIKGYDKAIQLAQKLIKMSSKNRKKEIWSEMTSNWNSDIEYYKDGYFIYCFGSGKLVMEAIFDVDEVSVKKTQALSRENDYQSAKRLIDTLLIEKNKG